MLPSYTKPNIQSVQPGMTGTAAPATPTGYATGANPITASRGAVADMTKAPAMPANPQVQTQQVPQAWQSQHYLNNMRSLYSARPELAGLGSLPPQAAPQAQQNFNPLHVADRNEGMTSATSQAIDPAWKINQRQQAMYRGNAAPVSEKAVNTAMPAPITNNAANQAALKARAASIQKKLAPPPPKPSPAKKTASSLKSSIKIGSYRGGRDNDFSKRPYLKKGESRKSSREDRRG